MEVVDCMTVAFHSSWFPFPWEPLSMFKGSVRTFVQCQDTCIKVCVAWEVESGERSRTDIGLSAISMMWVTLEKGLVPLARELNAYLVQDLWNWRRNNGVITVAAPSPGEPADQWNCAGDHIAWCPLQSIVAAASLPPSKSHVNFSESSP